MPPLRPPGVGEPTVPMTRSASAERVFRFRCRGFDTPPVPMLSATGLVLSAPPDPLLSAPSVPLPRARPSLCLVPVHSCAAHTRPSPFIPTLSVPVHFCAAHAARRRLSLRCPCQSVPALPVAFPPVSGAGASGRRLRHDGRSLDLSPRGSIYIGAAENSNGSTTERRLDRQKPGFCGTAGGAGCRSRTGALSSRRRYFCGKLL